MRNYYIFEKQHSLSGWMQLDTTWQKREDVSDAVNYEAAIRPDSMFLIGHDDDHGFLTIASSFDEIPSE